MKAWMPALAGLVIAAGLAAAAGVLFSGLAPGPGGSTPIVLKSMSPGTQNAAHLRLTQPALPVECQAAAWIHASLAGRCPISRSTAEAVARSAYPFVLLAGSTIAGAPTPAVGTSGRQVREAVLAWADLPAGALAGTPAQALHALVWVVAVDESAASGVACPPAVRVGAPMIRCGGAFRYLVFVDALSGKTRLAAIRP